MSLTQIDPKEFSEQDVNHANQTLIDEGLSVPDSYYIDLRIIKDFQLGALLYVIHQNQETAEANYQKLLACLPAYQTRDYDDWKAFSALPFVEDAKALYDDRVQHAELIAFAPTTKFIDVLDAHVIINANHSQLKDKFRKVHVSKNRYVKDWDDITFVVNVFPYADTSSVAKFVSAFLVDRYGVTVKPVSYAPFEIPGFIFEQCEELYLYRLDEFVESPEVQEKLEPLKHLKKKVFTTQIFNPAKEAAFPPERLAHEKRALRSYLNLFMTVSWIPLRRYSVIPELIPEDKLDG